MTKQEQLQVNRKIDEIRMRMQVDMHDCFRYYESNWTRLRTCSAWVMETDKFYVLRSYNTIIACIEKETDTLCDFLRDVYGFTHTSAQHISKFAKDYGTERYGCTWTLTWRSV